MKIDRHSHRPATLGDLAGQGLDVWAWCNGCYHHAVLPIAPLASGTVNDAHRADWR